jgi:GTPase
LNRRMMDTVRAALDQRDLLLFIADATRRFTEEDRRATSLVGKNGTPAMVAFNKIDLLGRDRRALLPLIEQYCALGIFADYLPISALTGDGLNELRDAIVNRLPEGPAYFPEDHITDQPERFLAAELIREKVLEATHEEVPHAVAVWVDKWEDTPRLTRIYATIHVERSGQKGILIGAAGGTLKRIGTLARKEMERLFDRRIYLDLHIKVQPGWRQKPDFLAALDWRTMAGVDEN